MAPLDEAIAQVVAVTQTSPERAAQYVQLADGDPDQAVTLFFENDGVDLAGISASPPAQRHFPSTSQPRTGDSNHPIDLDDDEAGDDDPRITGYQRVDRNTHDTFDEDARLAQKLQEEAYGDGGPDAEIRAPIARQAETLAGYGSDVGMGPSMDQINRRMLEMQQRRGRGFQTAPAGIFNQRESSAIWDGESEERDHLAESTGGASDTSSKFNTLARLFQPPWDLMFKESWDEARTVGREQQKWMMVNIQDGSVFACQVLNRDLWKNPGVVETLKENFVFLQYSKDDPRAESYTQYYFHDHQNPAVYPHISIVDPRTGEQVKLWSQNIPNAAEFLMQVHEFLDRYSLSHTVRNPVAKRRPEAAAKKSIDQMTEDELLQIAMQESLASQTNEQKTHVVEDPDDLTRSVGDLRKPGSDESGNSNDEPPSEPDLSTTSGPFAAISADRPHTEPAPGPAVTRIQIKHPAGRLIRRFALNDPVRRIYEFLKAEPIAGREGADFELVSMGSNLMSSIESTIDESGLKNGTVMVEYVESQ